MRSTSVWRRNPGARTKVCFAVCRATCNRLSSGESRRTFDPLIEIDLSTNSSALGSCLGWIHRPAIGLHWSSNHSCCPQRSCTKYSSPSPLSAKSRSSSSRVERNFITYPFCTRTSWTQRKSCLRKRTSISPMGDAAGRGSSASAIPLFLSATRETFAFPTK